MNLKQAGPNFASSAQSSSLGQQVKPVDMSEFLATNLPSEDLEEGRRRTRIDLEQFAEKREIDEVAVQNLSGAPEDIMVQPTVMENNLIQTPTAKYEAAPVKINSEEPIIKRRHPSDVLREQKMASCRGGRQARDLQRS